MHVLLCATGSLRVRTGRGAGEPAAGVVTGPDVAHEIDARGAEVFLVFIDPESAAGETLRAALPGPVRLVAAAERDALLEGASADEIMRSGGAGWIGRAADLLGSWRLAPRPPMHPRVRKLLRLLSATAPDGDTSLPALAEAVGLSPSRLMHVFTESIGVPLRPYLAWLRLQRAAAAVVGGTPLGEAATTAGFADAAHMSRTFRRMFGVSPSELRAASGSQPVHSRRPAPLAP
jgi:AraC-like DNA-binding protein